MNQRELLEFCDELLKDVRATLAAKNSDYTAQSEDAFANFSISEEFGVPRLVGLSVRMGDKFQRVKSFCKSNNLQAESAEDAFLDIIGYSVIALAMLSEKDSADE